MSKTSTQQDADAAETPSLRSLIFNRSSWKNTPENMLGRGFIQRGSLLRQNADNLKKVVAKKEYRKETFEEAVARKSLTEPQLLAQRGALIISSRISYAFALIAILCVGYFTLYGHIASVIASCVLFTFCVVGGWIRAFRAWQIETRKLAKLSDFTQAPESWIV